VIQFVGAEEGPEIGGNLSQRRRIADKRTAFAAEVRKGWKGAEAPAAPAKEAPADEQPAGETEETPKSED